MDNTNKTGIFDVLGQFPNPLNNQPYTQDYVKLAQIWSTYPAYEKAKYVIDTLKNKQLIFVVSSPGSGKTVLLPKFALHYTNYKGKIAITLPKRILTLSAATFAAKTLDVQLGKEVGYLYKGSPKDMSSESNRLVYMTDGYLITKFIRDPLLREYDIVILDEAHERRVSIDLLLLFLKNLLLSGKRPDLRVIIMSATIDPDKYKNYFVGIDSEIVEIAGQAMHDITVKFLSEPAESYMTDGLKLINRLIDTGDHDDMLFFITSSSEALQLCRSIRPIHPRVYCIEVYADMDRDLKIYAESRDKYLELGNYDQKLIMATNVAESSLTIDGLKTVIDSGYELYSYYDPDVMGQILEKKLISRAQALQRRGRVGRTSTGTCYHLLTHDQFDALSAYPEPDILKEDITLDIVKIIQITETKTFEDGEKLLNAMMDPPKEKYVDTARKLLELYNVIGPDSRLSTMGSQMAQFTGMPINRSLFLIYAYQLHCAREASIIIAMIEVLDGKISNLFHKTDTICDSDCRMASKKLVQKLVQRKGDHFTFLNIFQKFKQAADQKNWVQKYGLRMDILNRADKLSRKYYGKIIGVSREPQIGGATRDNANERILEALTNSHMHLTAKKLTTTYPQKKIQAQINRESAVYYYYDRQQLTKKTFIYDELVSINGNWEYSVVTIT